MSVNLTKGFVDTFCVKDVDLPSRTIIQAFTRYNVKDSDGDIGRKGMFNKTWTENAGRIKHLFNHKDTIGVIQKLWDDDDYAYFQSKIGTHNLGNDFMKMAESGIITEASYGYNVVKEKKTSEGNELLEVRKWEVSSLDKWGANQYTPVIAFQKSMGNDTLLTKYQNRLEALTKFCGNSTATDETIQYLLKEVEQLQATIVELSVSTQAGVPLEPQDSKDDVLMQADLLIKAALFNY